MSELLVLLIGMALVLLGVAMQSPPASGPPIEYARDKDNGEAEWGG